MKKFVKPLVLLGICAALVLLSVPVLHADSTPFLKWWLISLALGIGFWPLASRLFSTFSDGGWIFSKAIGTALAGYLVFTLVTCGIAAFNTITVILGTVFFAALCWILFAVAARRQKARKRWLRPARTEISWNLILFEEVLFLGLFLLWTYFAGCRPEAYGTEKFMDYGFMAAMMRDTSLPPRDLWYSSGTINYYYGGQYFAVYLTRLSGTCIEQTYNLMRTLVAAFAFVMPFSIVWHLLKDRKRVFSGWRVRAKTNQTEAAEPQNAEPAAPVKENPGKGRMILPTLGGIMAGAAVSLAGNMHYVLYGLFGKVLKLSGYDSYWFPSSTRFIGHNPLTEHDQCIHEFPSYSFVLGDLHAHMVNIMFVLCFIAILYAWFRKRETVGTVLPSLCGRDAVGGGELNRKSGGGRQSELTGRSQETNHAGQTGWKQALLRVLRDPHLWMLGIFAGIFQFTNFWDAAIYIVVGIIAFALALLRYRESGKGKVFLFRVLLLVGLALVIALPFRLQFTAMMNGIALSPYHSAFYQLLILWGLPVASVLILLLLTIWWYRKKDVSLRTGYVANLQLSDLAALLFGICAIGLILVPEVMYVRDIYEESYTRCNTMFKFTYQAYILLGISMSYALLRLLADVKKLAVRTLSAVLIGLFVLTCGYFPYAVKCWFGNVWSGGAYRQLNATAYLENVYPEDAGAIRWLNANIEGNPVVLEADGLTYSRWERVSAMTGLPTVMGWFTHEWLWRNDTKDLIYRCQDVRDIYTNPDRDYVLELIDAYDVDYIVVGSCERESYPDMNEGLLQSLGEIVYPESGEAGTQEAYIIRVAD